MEHEHRRTRCKNHGLPPVAHPPKNTLLNGYTQYGNDCRKLNGKSHTFTIDTFSRSDFRLLANAHEKLETETRSLRRIELWVDEFEQQLQASLTTNCGAPQRELTAAAQRLTTLLNGNEE